MSEAVTALAGQSFEGRVRVADAGLLGMITLRVDISDAAVTSGLHAAGFEMPGQGGVQGGLLGGALWMSPDEALLLCDYNAVEDTLERIKAQLDGKHFLAVDVSDARVAVKVTGEAAAVREVLAKLTPTDMRANAFRVGTVRRTRLAQVPAAIWFEDEGTAIVVAFRSVADYVFRLISDAADGGEVGYF